jgi:hypothetical protein
MTTHDWITIGSMLGTIGVILFHIGGRLGKIETEIKSMASAILRMERLQEKHGHRIRKLERRR